MRKRIISIIFAIILTAILAIQYGIYPAFIILVITASIYVAINYQINILYYKKKEALLVKAIEKDGGAPLPETES
jgi:hypothetical protein